MEEKKRKAVLPSEEGRSQLRGKRPAMERKKEKKKEKDVHLNVEGKAFEIKKAVIRVPAIRPQEGEKGEPYRKRGEEKPSTRPGVSGEGKNRFSKAWSKGDRCNRREEENPYSPPTKKKKKKNSPTNPKGNRPIPNTIPSCSVRKRKSNTALRSPKWLPPVHALVGGTKKGKEKRSRRVYQKKVPGKRKARCFVLRRKNRTQGVVLPAGKNKKKGLSVAETEKKERPPASLPEGGNAHRVC